MANAHKQFSTLWDGLLADYKILHAKPFEIYRTPVYANVPIISPHLIDHRLINPKSLAAFERIAKNKKVNPYLNIVKHPYETRVPTDQKMQALGYDFESTYRMNVFSKQKGIDLPKGATFKVGEFTDKAIFDDYARVSRLAFPKDSASFLETNFKFARQINARILTVVIYDKKRKPVATGGLFFGKSNCLLFSGGVAPRHRRRGLWSSLVGIRQALAKASGLDIAVLVTAVPALLNQADLSLEFVTYRRSKRGQ